MPPNSDYAEIAAKRYKEKKTHVSFPQLKYPSLRDEGLRDPAQWLTGKAMDDGADGLWRIHDKIYDFERFVKSHPGGEEWFELTKGTDITEAFESHHLNPVVEKMKDQYYVKDATTPRNSPLTFHEDGFYRTLKKIAKEELDKIPKDVQKQLSKNSTLIIDGLLITLLVTSVLSAWAKNPYVVNVSYLVAAYSLACITVAAHNYIHKKTNWRMYLFNLSAWSYRDFRVSHALSHHMYPNLANDLEISGFEPVVFWRPGPDKPFYSKFAFLLQCSLFPFMFLLAFIRRILLAFTREGFYKNHSKWHDCIGLFLPLWIWAVSGTPFLAAVYSWLWINCTASLIFYTIGSNAAHHHPEIFKDGDQVESETRDWGIHEVETLMDRHDINGSLYKVLTFFGDHTLHHLFPTVDHALLPFLYPRFLEECKKFKANFRLTSSLDLFLGQLKMANKREFTLLKDRKTE